MHIREIEIDNFKSFANKITIPFMDGFTTISGPNGSGKSNIIDSILFALGLSSSRSLRAEKIYHLISTHNKRDEASVKVTFTTEAENSDFTVMRRIRKTSAGYVSTYYLNDKTTTLTEIHDKLAAYNISPNSYNVMMQGDVTSIINTTPNERRKIIDEIAGVADFDRKIELAKRELETVEERVGKSSIILEEIEKRLVQLEEERKVALKHKALFDEKHALESQISIIKYYDAKNTLERIHESILDANKQKKEEESNLKKCLVELEQVREKLKEISELVKVRGEDEQIEIKKQMEGLKGHINRKEDAIQFIDKQIEESKQSSITAKNNIQKQKDKIDDILLKIDNKKDEIKILEKNIEKEKEELTKVLNDISNIDKAAEETFEKRNLLRASIESKKDEENLILKQKLPLDEKLNRLKQDIAEANEFIEKAKESEESASSQKSVLKNQVGELEKELKDFELMQKTNLYELDKLKNEISDAAYNVSLAYQKVTQLEANKNAIELAGFGRAIDTVLDSGIEGIHATLSQLGKVDKEYATALEIAIGGRMTNIVVEDDEVASMAIEILQTSKAGRATFLPLNKMRPAPRNMRAPHDRGVIDYAINLVEFDEIYRDVFGYALGDTLVVEDKEAARKFIGKYRMVTLDGTLLEKSGSMTGGSMNKARLSFTSTQDEELGRYKQRLIELETSKNQLEKKKISLEARQDEIRRDYSVALNDFNKKKLDLDNYSKNLEASKNLLTQKQEFLDKNEPEIVLIQKQVDEFNKKINALNTEIAKLSAEMETVDKSLPKEEMAKLKELTESVELEIKRNESKVLGAQSDIKTMNTEIEYSKQAIETFEENIKKYASNVETLLVEKENNKKEIEVIKAQLVELDVKIKEIGSELVELQQQRDEINNEVLECEKKKASIENKIERHIEQVEALKTRRKEFEVLLETLKEELKTNNIDIAHTQKPEITEEEATRSIARLQRRMDELGPVNMRALIEYDEVTARKDELKTKLDTLNNEKIQILERMSGYEDLKKQTFLETYNHINENFKDIFAGLSDGTGSLVLENPTDPLAGGLTIEAQPRDKKMQRLESMSGGEKSLTALAFVFAIQRYMPAPFYAFDEVDMHLDGINVEKLAAMIKKQAQNTQFVVVSLRKPMIESAGRTVGVTQKDSGITKVTGVRLSE